MVKKDRKLLILFAVGLSVLLVLRDIAGIGIPKYPYFVFVVLFMALAQYDTLVYMVCFILPLMCGLPGTYIMPCILVLLVFKRGSVNTWQAGMIAFVAVMEVIASFWYPRLGITALVNYISFAGVMLFLIHDNKNIDYYFCVQMYLYGVSVLCGTIMITGFMTAPSDWLWRFSKGWFRFGETQAEEIEGMKLALNANSLAYYSITGMVCGIMAIEQETGRKKTLYVLLTLLSTIVGFLTVSRSWVVAVAICALLYIGYVLRDPKKWLILLLIVALIIAAAAIYLDNHPELWEGFVGRFTDTDMKSANGRTDIFQRYMKVFLSDVRIFWLGTGVTQYKEVTEIYSSFHNGTQQILVSYGVLGFVVFLVGLIKPVLKAARGPKKKIKFVYWLPLLGIALFVQTIQFLTPTMLMLPYVIGVYAVKAGRMNEKLFDHS